MPSDTHRSDFRRVFLVLGTGVVGVFALIVVLGLLYFRAEIRHQILQRDGIHLTSLANFLNNRQSQDDFHEWELLHLAIDSIDVEGMIAVRVFDDEGQFTQGVPNTLFAATLSTDDISSLRKGLPVIRFHRRFPMYGLFNDFESEVAEQAPLIEVVSPIKPVRDDTIGYIQFWSDGFAISEEFRHLDHKLCITGFLLILSGGIIFLVLFDFARRRLLRLASLIEERNRSLEQANLDLAMAARTSAIGSVASHLFHGLKNPLAGLKTYLKVTSGDEEAVAIADRMQALIDESLSVIRDHDAGHNSHMSIAELKAEIHNRFMPLATTGNKDLVIKARGESHLDTRKVQLVLLVLRNLTENALAVSPEGGAVRIVLLGDGESLSVEVSDKGPGLPETVRSRLFEPVQSTKTGGTGIGLAISSVIARHIPARLELQSTGPEGTVFTLYMKNNG